MPNESERSSSVQPENTVMEQGVETRAEVRYAVENPTDFRAATRVWSEILPIMGRHFNELNAMLGLKFNPDWNQIAALLTSQQMVIATARRNNKLIGYQVWIINNTLHCLGTRLGYLWAVTGGRSVGADQDQLMAVSLQYLRAIGVTAVLANAKIGSGAMKLLERQEFKPMELMMGRPLWRSR
jgi:hypothetical protein